MIVMVTFVSRAREESWHFSLICILGHEVTQMLLCGTINNTAPSAYYILNGLVCTTWVFVLYCGLAEPTRRY